MRLSEHTFGSHDISCDTHVMYTSTLTYDHTVCSTDCDDKSRWAVPPIAFKERTTCEQSGFPNNKTPQRSFRNPLQLMEDISEIFHSGGGDGTGVLDPDQTLHACPLCRKQFGRSKVFISFAPPLPLLFVVLGYWFITRRHG